MSIVFTDCPSIAINLMPTLAPVRDMVANPVIYTTQEHRNVAHKRRAAQRSAGGAWRSRHSIVLTSRAIPVDEKISELLEVLWLIGFETQFSCEGDIDLFDESGTLENLTDAAHIVFPQVEQAVKFMEYSYRFLIHSRQDLPWSNLMNLELMLPTKDIHNVRAIVRFNPAALKSLTEYWKTSIVASH